MLSDLLRSKRGGSWPRHVREITLVVGAYFLYMFARKYLLSDIDVVAMANSFRVIDLERTLGFFWEPGWQEWVIATGHWLIIFFNWAYILTFLPVAALTAIIVYRTDYDMYVYYRSVILISFAVALLMFVLFPLAPPRMITGYFVDSIHVFGPQGYSSRDFQAFYNVFAAMPSLHFSWTIMFGILYFRTGKPLLRVAGVVYPTLTFFAITVTANHYIVDAIAGGALILASFLTYEVLRRYGGRLHVVGRLGARLRGSRPSPDGPTVRLPDEGRVTGTGA